jgi:hypothetical protein
MAQWPGIHKRHFNGIQYVGIGLTMDSRASR